MHGDLARLRPWRCRFSVEILPPGSLRESQSVSPHDPGESCPGLEQLPGAVRVDHPFRQRSRKPRRAVLTGCDKADEGDFVGTEKGATRLMVSDGPSRVALEPLDQAGKSRQGFLAVPGAELPGEFIPDKGPMIAVVLTEPEDPSAEGPNDQPLRRVEVGHRGRPRHLVRRREEYWQRSAPYIGIRQRRCEVIMRMIINCNKIFIVSGVYRRFPIQDPRGSFAPFNAINNHSHHRNLRKPAGVSNVRLYMQRVSRRGDSRNGAIRRSLCANGLPDARQRAALRPLSCCGPGADRSNPPG